MPMPKVTIDGVMLETIDRHASGDFNQAPVLMGANERRSVPVGPDRYYP
jgi:hypothetical protein